MEFLLRHHTCLACWRSRAQCEQSYGSFGPSWIIFGSGHFEPVARTRFWHPKLPTLLLQWARMPLLSLITILVALNTLEHGNSSQTSATAESQTMAPWTSATRPGW